MDNIEELLQKIRDKYDKDGEDPAIYLEGLYHQKYITYWEYIQTGVLLNLQNPVTNLPDEMVFITYHQITELYFKLALWECKQIREASECSAEFLANRLARIRNYFQHLSHSFSIMREGMEPEQFLQFRMALTPASGFQSVQFRYIELAMTPLINLVEHGKRKDLQDHSPEEQYENIYWKKGATEVDTGKKAMVLRQFEEKYDEELLETAKRWQGRTVWEIYQQLPSEKKNDENLIKTMRSLDKTVNVSWGKVHYKTARRYLEAGDEPKEATGGTNWRSYMQPANQNKYFFPELWSEKDKEQWGME